MSIREQIAAYRVAGQDSRGRTIQAIFAHYDSYVIYQAEDKLEIEGELEQLDNAQPVQHRLEVLMALAPNDQRGKTRLQKSIAVALVACMTGDVEECNRLLDKLIARMTQRAIEIGRLLYLGGTLIVGVVLSAASLIVYLSPIPPRTLPSLLTYMALFGGLGGVMSVAANLRRIQVSRDSGVWFNLGSGASRGMIAVLAGLFAYLAMESHLMLGILADRGDLLSRLCGGFIAGFSETLVPNTLRKAEGGDE